MITKDNKVRLTEDYGENESITYKKGVTGKVMNIGVFGKVIVKVETGNVIAVNQGILEVI